MIRKRSFGIILFTLAIAFSILACAVGAKPTATPEPTNTPKPTSTPKPTNTPVPPTDIPIPATNTPAPEATQAPEPTKAATGTVNNGVPAGEMGIAQVAGWKSSTGSWIVSGIIANNTDRAYSSVQVEVEILDKNDKSLYKESTYMDLWVLAPGESSPFSLYVFEELPDADHFAATIVGQNSTDSNRADVSFDYVVNTIDDAGYVHLTGEITNNGSEPARLNTIAGALFDPDGKLITADSYSTMLYYMAPGEKAPFHVSITVPDGTNTDTYQLFIDAQVTTEPNSYDVTITKENNGYLDSFGSYHLVGEITNNTAEPLSLTLVASLKDKDGQVIDVSQASMPFWTIEPGETLPYDFSGWNVVNAKDGYFTSTADSYFIQVDPSSIWSSSTAYVTITSENDSYTFDTYGANFKGTAVNNSDTKLTSIIVSVTLFNKETKQAIATNYTYVEDLEAGAKSEYSLTLYVPDGIDPATVEFLIVVKGSKP